MVTEQKIIEVGVQYQEKTFWKHRRCTVFLLHNALGHLAGVITEEGTHHTELLPSSYGPQVPTPSPSDLLSYAQSLSWYSKSQNPTGLIWMGKRYYDPKGGRFLSSDPVSYPTCLDLYTYANSDPINYTDLDGRFASRVYQETKETVITLLNNSPIQGSMQAFVGAPLGWPIMAHRLDQFIAGMDTVITGKHSLTATEQISLQIEP